MADTAQSDAAILTQLIGLHYATPPSIVDTTAGGLRMWRGCRYQPTTTFDRRPLPGIQVVGEWADLPSLVAPHQVAVWDPPHQTDGSSHALRGWWAPAYGTDAADLRGHPNINHLYVPFLDAVRPVLTPKTGTLLVKLADTVHNRVQHLQAVDFVIACREAGWTVCEMVPKMRRPGPPDPKWRRQYHVRKAWSYWICAHPGPRCAAVGIDLVRVCPGCGESFHPKRKDRALCGKAGCQSRVWRARKAAPLHAIELRNRENKRMRRRAA